MTDAVDQSEAAFRAEVVAFLEATLPRKGAPGHPPSGRDYQASLAAGGLVGITWPSAFGGRGLSARFQRVFDREAAAFQVPPKTLEIGLGMCGPTILAHGTEEQKLALIPPLLRGDHVWCELFSEPGSGSDLASVQTSARRDGDTWIVNGQKVWTSGAQYSDFGACLTRTDPDRPKREGITMLLVDMHAPGVTVRPLRQMTGDAHFNEVFLDDVRVPAENVLGDVDGGWRVARTMLAFERQTLGAMGSSGGGRGGMNALAEAGRSQGRIADPVVRQLLAQLRIRQMVLRYLGQYLSVRGGGAGDASLLKLAMAQLVQATAEAGVNIAGPSSVAWEASSADGDRWSAQLLNSRSSSIGGGTNEIVRNVIAEQALGLPHDVEVDRDLPFREVRVGTQRG